MLHGNLRPPPALNEPILPYAPGSPERAALKQSLASMGAAPIEIPLVIGCERVHSGATVQVRAPHRHERVLAVAHQADEGHVERAIAAAIEAKAGWARTPFHERAAIFLRAAELLATRYRPVLNAATMLGQSKTVQQAEIDSACEAIDFLRFNVQFAHELYGQQPASAPGTWNLTDYRPLDGFVFAVAPFNFTAIAVNLCAAPALMGNTVLFKPAQTALLSAWHFVELLREAGLPDGVVNFVPGPGPLVGEVVTRSPDLGGVHFTGSTRVFNGLWKAVAGNLDRYRQYPRLVGETGGKDFIFVHASAADDLEALAVAIVRGAFEYQGQKCSACSRVYAPRSLWPRLEARLRELVAELRMGDPEDFRTFMGAVIDEASFDNAGRYLAQARAGGAARIVAGGGLDKSGGWFVEPTLVELSDPRHPILCEEIFAPICGVFVYPDEQYVDALRLCDRSAAYALTGSIFARDRRAISTAMEELRFAAGNFYINDKCTGAVVGQQPFGGARTSGTNDKAGSGLNLVRWVSARTVKENFCPPVRFDYPSMREP